MVRQSKRPIRKMVKEFPRYSQLSCFRLFSLPRNHRCFAEKGRIREQRRRRRRERIRRKEITRKIKKEKQMVRQSKRPIRKMVEEFPRYSQLSCFRLFSLPRNHRRFAEKGR